MWPSVKANLLKFLAKHEGVVHWMYIDVLGFVTTGIGNLIDSVSAAQQLPWKRADGSLASQSEIEEAWQAVDGARTQPKGERQVGSIALNGGASSAMAALTTIRLSDNDIQNLAAATALRFESTLQRRFPAFESWPADAQMGILGMAWALGPAFNFPKFQSAVNAVRPDFAAAALQASWNGINPGRKADEFLLFSNAAAVAASGSDFGVLHWPNSFVASGGGKLIGSIGLGVGIGYGIYRVVRWILFRV